MKILKDTKVIILIAILMIFTIGYFIIVNKYSYSFVVDYDVNDSYNNTINMIKNAATVYAERNADLFKNEDIVYIKVQDLIDNNYIYAKSDGNVLNPLNNESMNSNMIKLKKEDNEISVEIDS